ncbi:MAG: glycosyltransferase family 2 protein [Planctomycetes bacterium]|nr:glycosyltransferase family 2 protein [Planctomycetota bacterium]
MESIDDFLKLISGTSDRLASLPLDQIVRMLWFCFFLDLPRYVIPNTVIFLRELLGMRGRIPWPPDGPNQPMVTVLIPAYNEGETIARTVRSIRESNYSNIEIIIVDDGSTDCTPAVGRAVESSGHARFFRKEERCGKASCLNLALEMARGEFIVCIDADSSLDRDAIRKILVPFQDPNVGAVSGCVKVRNRDENLLTRLQACEYLVSIALGRRFLGWIGFLTIVSGAFGCFRRSTLSECGAWDPGIGDDSNVTLKTRKLGQWVAFAPNAVAMTDAPTTLAKFFRQRRRWSRSYLRNRLRKHRDLFNLRVYGLRSFFALTEGLLYTAVLLLGFIVYLAFNIIYRPGDLPLIAVLAFIVYSFVSCSSVAIAIFLSERRAEEWHLLFAAPFLVFYRLILKAARVVAFSQEIFVQRARDPFYPDKVAREMPVW